MQSRLLTQIYNPVLPPKLGGGPSGDATTGTAVAGNLISSLISVFLMIAFILAFLFVLLGGISWITAGGDKAKLETARNQITHAIVGLIVVAAAYAIFMLIGNFLGFQTGTGSINLILPTIN